MSKRVVYLNDEDISLVRVGLSHVMAQEGYTEEAKARAKQLYRFIQFLGSCRIEDEGDK